nr:uncharacterized protein LOC112037951 [Quercus suber]
MSPPTCYPPHRIHTHLTRALTPFAAQDALSNYLSQTEKHAYLHPDSQLSTTSIDYAAQSGPTGGLVIHHLRRIAAGLRGENLAAETEEELAQFSGGLLGGAAETALLEGDDARMDVSVEKHGNRQKRKGDEIEEWAERASDAGGFADKEQWQDKQEYERQQEILDGEVGERGGTDARSDGNGVAAAPPVDKAARKAAKKAKLKEEKSKRKASGLNKDEDT